MATDRPTPVPTSPGGNAPGVQVNDLEKVFHTRSGDVTALTDVSFAMSRGDFVSIIGPSGCGKSTVMRVLGGLDTEFSGTATIHGQSPDAVRRAHRVGVAFQDSAMMPWRTVRGNLELPYKIAGETVDTPGWTNCWNWWA
ncbi:ATP-binding cassette domain-containing protein [Brevibacterium sp. 50QC2O2]|uniref:ATP-binding cassette domain-containing protein n=1 Tax=Brevibacterium sp. 50QC2O2 TaxID=2968459 RepID=UPI00211B751F|nr:ATP-binding cassette domain-containing protein [Brevibacterium sp. 50QC2O2]MCQ9388237.1 ATP-binding cassette domain-containing protein [Brevibacterium sp. 50QC2O2]